MASFEVWGFNRKILGCQEGLLEWNKKRNLGMSKILLQGSFENLIMQRRWVAMSQIRGGFINYGMRFKS